MKTSMLTFAYISNLLRIEYIIVVTFLGAAAASVVEVVGFLDVDDCTDAALLTDASLRLSIIINIKTIISTDNIEDTLGGCGLGGAYDHI